MNMAEHFPLYAPNQSPPASPAEAEDGPSLSAFEPRLALEPRLAFEPLSARQLEHALLTQALLEAQSPGTGARTTATHAPQLSARRSQAARAAFLAAWSFAVLGATLGMACESNPAHAAPAVSDALGALRRTDAASNQAARVSASGALLARGGKTHRVRPFEPSLTRLHLPNPLSRLSKRPDFAQVQAQKQQAHAVAHSTRVPVAVIRPTQLVERGTPRTRVVQIAEMEGERSELASLPPAQNAVPLASDSLPSWLRNPASAPMSKIIAVQALKLPPTSRPLPSNLRAATVSADAKFISSLPPTLPRLAQNPLAPPLRRPERPVTNSDSLPNQIEVAVGTFVVLLTNTDLQTVAVAEPNTADVAVVNARSVLVNGKTPGITSLVVVDRLKIRQYQVRVVPAVGTRPTDVAVAIGLPEVQVRQLRDALILEGEVNTPEEARRAVEVAGIYSSKVINQLTVRGASTSEGAQAAQIQSAINLPNVSVRVISIGDTNTTLLEGTVDNGAQLAKADRIARALSKNVLNEIQLPNLSVEQVRESLGLAQLANGASGGANSTDGSAPLTGAGSPSGTVGAGGDGTGNGAGVNVPGAALPGVVPGSVVPGTNIPGFESAAPAFGMAGQILAPQTLSVRQVGDQIILEGAVATQAQADQALASAQRSGLAVVNRLQVATAPGGEGVLLNTIAAAIGRPGITVRGTAKRLVLEGVVPDTNAAVAAEQIARGFATQVDNLLQTPNPQLVDVDISIVEITRTNLKSLGFTFPSLADAQGFVIGQRSVNGDAPGILAGSRVGQTIDAFQAVLRAEVTSGNARLLSNPRTTVLSGRTATFQVGGQVPVPVSVTLSATGTTTGIAFKDFGVLVDVVPNAGPDGVVTMRVRAEVSQPDFSIGFTPFAGSTRIPGFTRRATVTEVTTQPGGTIALSGLIQHTRRQLVNEIPVLSKIPILGALFTSKRFQNDQTELVIFVTPRVLPNPLAPGMTAPAGVVAVGNTTNSATVLGNPGISTFNAGIAGGAAAGGSQ